MSKVFYQDNIMVKELKKGLLYSFRIKMDPDNLHDGKWWTKTKKVRAFSRAEALAKAVASKQSVEFDSTAYTVTFPVYAREWHVARGGDKRDGTPSNARPLVSARTLKRDNSIIAKIERYFEGIMLADVSIEIIEEAYRKALEDGCSQNVLHMLNMKVRQVLEDAVEKGYLLRNVAKAVKVRKPSVSKESRKNRRITLDEARLLAADLMSGEKVGYKAAIWIALNTGLRSGEILALTWSDIDLVSGALEVSAQYDPLTRTTKDPKTKSSYRTIALDKATVDWLAEWKDEQRRYFLSSKEPWNEDVPVVTNQLCTRPNIYNFLRAVKDYFIRLGLGRYKEQIEWVDSRGIARTKYKGYVGPTMHSLRHTQATMLVAAGEDPKTVQARLGHSSILTTLQIYAEAVEEKDRGAAARVSKLLGTS